MCWLLTGGVLPELEVELEAEPAARRSPLAGCAAICCAVHSFDLLLAFFPLFLQVAAHAHCSTMTLAVKPVLIMRPAVLLLKR